MTEKQEKALEVLNNLVVTLSITHLGGGDEICIVLDLVKDLQNQLKDSLDLNKKFEKLLREKDTIINNAIKDILSDCNYEEYEYQKQILLNKYKEDTNV